MQQTGIIREVYGDKAMVEIVRATACGGECHKCSGCETTSTKVEAHNMLNAEVGQRVRMEMEDSHVLFAAFIIYIIPLLMLFIGYGISRTLFGNELINGLSGLMFMGISFWVLRKKDQFFRQSQKYELKITKILQ